jgi:anti-sigma-K factor RskA
MKTPSEDHDLIRWLDAEMTDAERASFSARLESDPALKAEVELMQRMSADLRTHLPAEMPVPYGDFFNSQIQVRLAQEEPLSIPETRASWLDWLRMPTLIAATAAAAVAIAGFLIMQQGPAAGDSVVLSIYVPNTSVQARSFHSDEANATVLMLDGMEAMPADRKIVGYHIERSETDQEVATTTLYGERGEVVLVVSKDARNQPRLLSSTPRG